MLYTGFKDMTRKLTQGLTSHLDSAIVSKHYQNSQHYANQKMKISSRARYGTRAVVDIALHEIGHPVKLKDVAHRQHLSIHYLQQLILPLKTAGLLRTTPGIHGGVRLGKPPQEIRLSDLIQVLEGSIAPVECVDKPDWCSRAAWCVTRNAWVKVRNSITKTLDAITVQDLVEEQKNLEINKNTDSNFQSGDESRSQKC